MLYVSHTLFRGKSYFIWRKIITFWYGLNTTKTSESIDLGHSMKTKMAATAV